MGIRGSLAVIGVLATAVLSTASAQPAPAASTLLEQGEAAMLEADFPSAKARFEEVLGTSGTTPELRALAHVHLASLALIFGQDGAAEQHARLAIAFYPAVAVPPGSPRSLVDLLQTLNAEQPAPRLALLRDDQGATLQLQQGVPGYASALEMECVRGEASRRETGRPPELRLELGQGPQRCSGRAVGPGNEELLQVRETWTVDERSSSRGLIIGSAVGAAVLAIVLTTVLVVTLNRDDEPSFNRTVVLPWSR